MRIGVLTGGGDCPGLNAVIRAVVRTAVGKYGHSVVGFEDGWRGLLEDRKVRLLNDDRNDRLLAKGGTVLGTARTNPEKLKAGIDQIKRTLDDNGIDVLIPIGGEGTLTAASWLSDEGVHVVGVPKTIDNDIDCTDVTFGHDTAVSIATDAIDRLHTTAESHQRVMLVEVMGRHAGWIALASGLAAGAHLILVPEQPFDVDDVCRTVKARFQRGDKHFICVVAEGAEPDPKSMTLRDGGIDEFGHKRFTGVAHQLAMEIERRIGKEVRTTVLGHVQRGGTPTPSDRILATRFGTCAVEAAQAGEFGKMVALHGTQIELVPLVGSDEAAQNRSAATLPRSLSLLRLRLLGLVLVQRRLRSAILPPGFELIEVDDAVAVLVDLAEPDVDLLAGHTRVEDGDQLRELGTVDGTVLVPVELVIGFAQVIGRDAPLLCVPDE